VITRQRKGGKKFSNMKLIHHNWGADILYIDSCVHYSYFDSE